MQLAFVPRHSWFWHQSTRKFGTGVTCRAQLLMILLVVMSTHEIKTICPAKEKFRDGPVVFLRLVDPMWFEDVGD